MIAEPAAVPQGRLSLKTLTRPLTTVIGFQSQPGTGCRVSRALQGVTRAFAQKEKKDCANKAKLRATKIMAATYLARRIFPFWYSKVRFKALKFLFLLRTIHLFYFSSHFFLFNMAIMTAWVSSRGIFSEKRQAITRESEGILVCDSQTDWWASRTAFPGTEAKSNKSLLFTTFTYMCVTSIESLWYFQGTPGACPTRHNAGKIKLYRNQMLVPDIKNESLDCKHYSKTTIKKNQNVRTLTDGTKTILTCNPT